MTPPPRCPWHTPLHARSSVREQGAAHQTGRLSKGRRGRGREEGREGKVDVNMVVVFPSAIVLMLTLVLVLVAAIMVVAVVVVAAVVVVSTAIQGESTHLL